MAITVITGRISPLGFREKPLKITVLTPKKVVKIIFTKKKRTIQFVPHATSNNEEVGA